MMTITVLGILAFSLLAVLLTPIRPAPDADAETWDDMLLSENNASEEVAVGAWLRHLRDDVVCPQTRTTSALHLHLCPCSK